MSSGPHLKSLRVDNSQRSPQSSDERHETTYIEYGTSQLKKSFHPHRNSMWQLGQILLIPHYKLKNGESEKVSHMLKSKIFKAMNALIYNLTLPQQWLFCLLLLPLLLLSWSVQADLLFYNSQYYSLCLSVYFQKNSYTAFLLCMSFCSDSLVIKIFGSLVTLQISEYLSSRSEFVHPKLSICDSLHSAFVKPCSMVSLYFVIFHNYFSLSFLSNIHYINNYYIILF